MRTFFQLPLLALAVSLSAQTTKPVAPVKQQVTVTASRTPLGTSVTASSIRILNAQNLQETPAFTLDDRLRQIPGMELYRRTSGWVANPTTQGISLRGLGSTAASRTLVISDQVPLNDPFGGWIHWNEIPALAIDRVEVLRGGASDLYGSSAVGGVIDVVPVKPTDVRRIVQIGGGGLGTVSGDGILTGSHHGWSGLSAVSVLRTDGYITVAPEQRGAVDRPAGVRGGQGGLKSGAAMRSRECFCVAIYWTNYGKMVRKFRQIAHIYGDIRVVAMQ
ncbi:MAG: Plug domain-containing protein [Acidobacteria bacterium]|nr:Plug domain-containing protein [Acidobacteriota bacterium]